MLVKRSESDIDSGAAFLRASVYDGKVYSAVSAPAHILALHGLGPSAWRSKTY